jgi:hypothetical protein
MGYCRNLQFTEKPDYLKIKILFSKLALRKGIDLFDKVYDWTVRATTIKFFPHFYDFIEHQNSSPFNDWGKFNHSPIENKHIEAEIYKKAKDFEFKHPG